MVFLLKVLLIIILLLLKINESEQLSQESRLSLRRDYRSLLKETEGSYILLYEQYFLLLLF
jgi:hypothetical protein